MIWSIFHGEMWLAEEQLHSDLPLFYVCFILNPTRGYLNQLLKSSP